MKRAGIVVLLAGCHSILGIDDFQTSATIDGGTDGVMTDGAIDAIDGPDEVCFGTLATICFSLASVGPVMINGAINTDADARCQVRTQPGGPDLCVIAGSNVTVAAASVTGSRPLVLVGVQNVVVQGTLNVSSARLGQIGAGANVAACAANRGADSQNGGGGGAGGTFGLQGGAGGQGGGGTLGGVTGPTIVVTRIRGGCAGGGGGIGEGTVGGLGGRSGGAVALIAGAQVRIETAGAVYASGSGGNPVDGNSTGRRGGGAGGGSGGLIVLEAPMIIMPGIVAANGGGGSGGARDNVSGAGADGSTTNYTAAASGGIEDSNSGRGGAGGAGATISENGQNAGAGAGGGGGGGGGGVIWVKGTLTGTRFSPSPTLN